jgi:hypothetical protein
MLRFRRARQRDNYNQPYGYYLRIQPDFHSRSCIAGVVMDEKWRLWKLTV